MTDATFCISGDHFVRVFSNINYHTFDNNNIYISKSLKELHDVKMIDCSSEHILYLDFDGSVFSSGENYKGQLGLDQDYTELEKISIPQKIDIPPCKQIACDGFFSMCLTEDNVLYSFGSNRNGQLGLDSNKNNYNSPQLIPNLHNVEYIACGFCHTICKIYDNTYYGWGCNFNGQIGHDKYQTYNKPTLCNNYPDNIIYIKCGHDHTLLLTLEGNIYSFGSNSYGQLGLNDSNIKETNTPTLIKDIPEIRRIECGSKHSMCIDVNDYIWLFGGNDEGQLGLGDKNHRYKPILHPMLSNIMDISSRGYGTFIKTLDQKIYAFGLNDHSQLGIKTSEKKRLTPIQVFQDNEDIWGSFTGRSKQKSARK